MNRDPEWYDEDAIARRCEEDMLHLAILQLEKERAEKLQKEAQDGGGLTDEEIEKMYRASLPRVKKRIYWGVQKQHAASFVCKTLPRVMRAAAFAIAALSVLSVSAMAVSPAVRVYVTRFLIDVRDEYTSLSLVKDMDVYVDVPEGWQGEYFPAYLPEGYAFMQVYGGASACGIKYFNDSGDVITFMELSASAQIDIDTEDANVTYATIHGSMMLQSEKEGRVTLAWAYANKFFVLTQTGTLEEIRQIAESIVKIK